MCIRGAEASWTVVIVSALVIYNLENPVIVIFGILDVGASIWTAIALRTDETLPWKLTTNGSQVL